MYLNTITIVLPNYNSQKYLEETLNSIITQNYKDWNLQIIDDNSNDETLKILRRFENNKNINITYLKKNMGAGYCRNLAIEKSNSKYIAFIDSDDIWEKDKLSSQIKFMEQNNIKFSYTSYCALNEKTGKKTLIVPPKKFNYRSFIKNTSIATSTMIIAREIVTNIKFSETEICEDYFFKCLLLKKVGFAFALNTVLTKYKSEKVLFKVISLKIYIGFGK